MFNIEKVMEQSEIGFAKHQILYDEKGQPVDYRFQAVNPTFENITGLKREALLNRRITEVMPKITQGDFDWIGFFGNLVTAGKKEVFEHYASPLDKWYRVEVFSCEKDCFTTLYTDITNERELIQASKAFLDDEQKANTYEEITQRMKHITGADYVALNVFLEDGEHFQTVAIEGVSSALKKVSQILGFNPQKKEWPPDPHRMALIREKTVTTFDHLHELTNHVLPKTAIQLLEKTFNLGRTVVIKSTQGEKIIGDFTLMFSKRNELQNENEAIIYSDMVGMLIERRKGLQKLAKKENQLQESRQQLDTIVSNTPAVIYTYRIDTKGNPNITFINENLKKVLGFEPDDFIDNTSLWERCVHPEDLPNLQEKLSGKNMTNEYRFQDKNGNYHWLLDKQKVLKKEAGLVEIIGTWWDITERKLAEEKLFHLLSNQELSAKISSVFVNTPVEQTESAIGLVLQTMAQFFKVDRIGIFQISPDGLYLNNTYEYCAQKVASIQKHLQQIQLKKEETPNPLDPCEVEAMILKAHPKPQKEEKYTCNSLVVINMLNEGKNAGFIYFDSGLNQKEWSEDDLSQIKFLTEIISNTLNKKELTENLMEARKKAEEANQAKSDFLANMNHELRTPLNGIIGFSDILRTMPLDEELKGFVDIVYTSGKHLADIITEILDFSRIEAGKFELNTEKTELNPLIKNTLSMVRPKAEGKGLGISSSIEHSVPEIVEVDGSRLRQVLLNLIANAVKFTDEGTVSVSVSLLERQRDQARLLFKVTDTGMGIKEEEQKKIFDPFHQADMAIDKKAQGTGLGLAISKKMLELMDTSLELESEYGKGSTFSFELELSCDETTDRDTTADDLTQEHSLFKNKKVLIVEDDPVNMQFAQTALGMLSKDIQIITAENGEEGYEQYREHQPDLILMDIRMPKLDGYQATGMIRSHNEDVPIIAMTAKALEEDKEDCLAAGMNEYLTKPVSMSQLKDLLYKYL